MPPQNRRRPVRPPVRTGPRSSRVRGTGPARSAREPVAPVDNSLAVHGYLVIAVHGQLDDVTAARLKLAIIASRDGYAEPDPSDPAATTLRDAVGLGALVISCFTCSDIDVKVTVGDPSPLVAQLAHLAGVPAP